LVTACIPEEKQAELKEELKMEEESLVPVLRGIIVGHFSGNSAVFALGWAVHTFLAQ
jgi:hypothetical protein